MLLTTAITAVRERIRDTNTASNPKFSNGAIARFLNDAARSLFSTRVMCDPSYHNLRLDSDSALVTTSQLHTGVRLFELPPWVKTVTEVRLKTGSTLEQGALIETLQSRSEAYGWLWDGPSSLRVSGPDSDAYTFAVTKVPARAFSGTLPTQANVASTELRLPVAPTAAAVAAGTAFEIETAPGAYINASIEITGVDSASHLVGGQVRRVTASVGGVVEAGAVYPELTVNTAWGVAPAAADTFDMHFEVADDHALLLVMRAVNTCFSATNNTAGLESISRELASAIAKFNESVTPRQQQTPYFLGRGRHISRRYDLDREQRYIL